MARPFQFNVEKLCELVQSHSCLWDKKDPTFKDKKSKDAAWSIITSHLDVDYARKNLEEKKDTEERVKDKFINMKDAYFRSLKPRRGHPPKKKYCFADHLSFLLAAQEPSFSDSLEDDTLDDSISSQPDMNQSMSNGSLVPSIKRPRLDSGLTRIEDEILKELKTNKPRSNFFVSFEQYVEDMTEMEKIELQMNILNAIMDIKSRRQ